VDYPVTPSGGQGAPLPPQTHPPVPPQGPYLYAVPPQTPPVPSPEEETKSAYNRIGLAYFGLVAVTQFALAPLVAVLIYFFPSLAKEAWFNVAFSFFALYCVGMPAVLLCLKGMPKNDIIRRPFSFSSFVKITVISLSVMNLLNFFSLWLVRLLEGLIGSEISSPLDQSMESSGVWFYLLSAVVIAPVFEELLFRRILLTRLVRFGEWPAVLVSALIFSLVHGNFFQIFYAFAVGILLGWLYLRTGRLLYTVLLHFLLNFFGSVPGVLIERFCDTEGLDAFLEDPAAVTGDALAALIPTIAVYGLYLLALVAVIVCGVVFLIRAFRRERLRLSLSPFPAKKTAGLIFGNVGMILFLLVSAAVILVSLMS